MAFALPAGLAVTWLGHATFLFDLPNGKRLLVDPWLDQNPSTPPDKKDVADIDLLLITHGHFDHIGDAVSVATKTNCKIVAVPEIGEFLHGKGVFGDLIFPMNKGGTIAFPDLGLSVTMTAAFHSGGINEGENMLYGGEPSGFVVTLGSGFAFYFAGDTCVFGDMALIAELYQPTLAFLPIGDCFTMGPREASKAAELLSTVQAIIPMHWGTFPLLTGTPRALQDAIIARGLTTEVLEMAPGQTLGPA